MNKSVAYKIAAIIIASMLILTPMIPGVFALVMSVTDSAENVFNPIPPDSFKGDFTVYSDVEHALGDTYSYPDNMSFDITVSLGEGYANQTLGTSMGELKADENGVLYAKVAPGSLFAVRGVLINTKVTVTHSLGDRKGFSPKDGVVSQTVTYTPEYRSVRFVSVYTPDIVSLSDVMSLGGSKDLENIKWGDGDKFEFVLEYKDGDRWVVVGTTTLDYEENSNGQFSFDDIIKNATIDSVGDHEFRISEKIGDMDESAYDTTYKYFTLVVSDDDMDGALEVSGVKSKEGIGHMVDEESGKYLFHTDFTNTQLPYVPDDITVSVEIDNNVNNQSDGDVPHDKYSFIVENTQTGEKTTVTADENGKAKLDLTFTPDDAGKDFVYKIYPADGGVDGAEFSDKIYEIVISIGVNENGDLTAAMVCDGKPCETLSLVFDSIYDPQKPFYSWPLIFTGAMAAAAGGAWPISTYSIRAVRKKKGLI